MTLNLRSVAEREASPSLPSVLSANEARGSSGKPSFNGGAVHKATQPQTSFALVDLHASEDHTVKEDDFTVPTTTRNIDV